MKNRSSTSPPPPTTVSVDPDSNAGVPPSSPAKILTPSPTTPTSSPSELSALAGPAAGPNGGQIYIDGFTGGQLPPKSSIREIRINQNPFSAEYDRPGFGRVEIFTKPGTDKFHGNAQLNGFDKAFNTGSPFIGNTPQPGYHTIFFFGSAHRPHQQRRVVHHERLVPRYPEQLHRQPARHLLHQPDLRRTLQSRSGRLLRSSQTVGGNGGGNGFTLAQFTPQKRFDVNPRVDLALGSKNTLTARFQYTSNNQQNLGIGNNRSRLHRLQLRSYGDHPPDQRLPDHLLQGHQRNTLRVPAAHHQSITPFSTAPNILVQGAFTGGGNRGPVLQRHPEPHRSPELHLRRTLQKLHPLRRPPPYHLRHQHLHQQCQR